MVILNIEGLRYYVTKDCSEFFNMREIRENF